MLFGSEEATCRVCAQIYPASDLDRHLWCPACRAAMRRRGAIWARLSGLISSIGVASYIVVVVNPSNQYLLFYSLILILTYVLTSRIALAIVTGVYRARASVTRSSGRDSSA